MRSRFLELACQVYDGVDFSVEIDVFCGGVAHDCFSGHLPPLSLLGDEICQRERTVMVYVAYMY